MLLKLSKKGYKTFNKFASNKFYNLINRDLVYELVLAYTIILKKYLQYLFFKYYIFIIYLRTYFASLNSLKNLIKKVLA